MTGIPISQMLILSWNLKKTATSTSFRKLTSEIDLIEDRTFDGALRMCSPLMTIPPLGRRANDPDSGHTYTTIGPICIGVTGLEQTTNRLKAIAGCLGFEGIGEAGIQNRRSITKNRTIIDPREQ